MNHSGINFIINLDDELALLVSEVREQKVGDNDSHKLFFTYLIKVVFNNSLFKTIEYNTTASAITLLEETIGLITRDHLDIPKQEYDSVITSVVKIQEALAVNELLVNAIANNILAKIYRTFIIDNHQVQLTQEDNLIIQEINIQLGYTWSSHKFITKASLKINISE